MPKIPTTKSSGLIGAIAAAGGVRNLARGLGLDHSTVVRWTKVPYERLLDVEHLTGVPREMLCPELFRKKTK